MGNSTHLRQSVQEHFHHGSLAVLAIGLCFHGHLLSLRLSLGGNGKGLGLATDPDL